MVQWCLDATKSRQQLKRKMNASIHSDQIWWKILEFLYYQYFDQRLKTKKNSVNCPRKLYNLWLWLRGWNQVCNYGGIRILLSGWFKLFDILIRSFCLWGFHRTEKRQRISTECSCACSKFWVENSMKVGRPLVTEKKSVKFSSRFGIICTIWKNLIICDPIQG